MGAAPRLRVDPTLPSPIWSQIEESVRYLVASGALLSEMPMRQEPLAGLFPQRNRLISGLCLGVVVVEATPRSGSLSTAHHAMEQNREVFAVPGNINTLSSRGTNSLIKEGAKLVQGVEDILEELPLRGTGGPDSSARSFTLSPQEAALYTLLAESPLHIDDLTVRCDLPVATVSALLLGMELKGAVMQMPGKIFSLS